MAHDFFTSIFVCVSVKCYKRVVLFGHRSLKESLRGRNRILYFDVIVADHT